MPSETLSLIFRKYCMRSPWRGEIAAGFLKSGVLPSVALQVVEPSDQLGRGRNEGCTSYVQNFQF